VCGLAHAGHDEREMDDAIAVERARAQYLGIVQVASQHVGVRLGDGTRCGIRPGETEDLMTGGEKFGDDSRPDPTGRA
jgi:hypothetical protein